MRLRQALAARPLVARLLVARLPVARLPPLEHLLRAAIRPRVVPRAARLRAALLVVLAIRRSVDLLVARLRAARRAARLRVAPLVARLRAAPLAARLRVALPVPLVARLPAVRRAVLARLLPVALRARQRRQALVQPLAARPLAAHRAPLPVVVEPLAGSAPRPVVPWRLLAVPWAPQVAR